MHSFVINILCFFGWLILGPHLVAALKGYSYLILTLEIAAGRLRRPYRTEPMSILGQMCKRQMPYRCTIAPAPVINIVKYCLIREQSNSTREKLLAL